MIGHLKAECHQGDYAGELQVTLGKDEGDICRKNYDAVLDHFIAFELGYEEDGHHGHQIAEQGASQGDNQEFHKRRPAEGSLAAESSEEQHEKYDARTVIEQGFTVHESGETLAGIEFLQQGYNGNGVSGAHKGSEHQREGPVPAAEFRHYQAYTHHQQSHQSHRHHDARYGQYAGIHEGLAESMQVQFICRTENQNR